jgi:hypothetical protein
VAVLEAELTATRAADGQRSIGFEHRQAESLKLHEKFLYAFFVPEPDEATQHPLRYSLFSFISKALESGVSFFEKAQGRVSNFTYNSDHLTEEASDETILKSWGINPDIFKEPREKPKLLWESQVDEILKVDSTGRVIH